MNDVFFAGLKQMGGVPEARAIDPTTGEQLGVLGISSGAGPIYHVIPAIGLDFTKTDGQAEKKKAQEPGVWEKDWVLLLTRKQP